MLLVADTLQEQFFSSLDWNHFEISLRDALYDLIDQILLPALQKLLEDREKFLPALKQLAATKAMRLRPQADYSQASGIHHRLWVEPKLLTIQFIDKNGKLLKEIPAIYDATLSDIENFFDVLELYLQQLDLASAHHIVFCADGAPCLWKRIPDLMAKLNVAHWHEALDYTHAKQNLHQIAEMIPRSLARHRQKIFAYWKDLLWHGEFDELRSTIVELFRSTKKGPRP